MREEQEGGGGEGEWEEKKRGGVEMGQTRWQGDGWRKMEHKDAVEDM